MEIRLPRNVDAVGEIFAPIERFCREEELESRATFHLKMTVEELFTNLVKHNEGGGGYILLELEADAARITARLTDYDVQRFEVAETDPVELRRPLSERGEGGLGLNLVRSMVDTLTYSYRDGALVVCAIKNREDKHREAIDV
jgi:anti-sigma regulatory factor (Ser/Thr protein kinase)